MLWISSEALINQLAEDRWRGRIIGIYASVGAAGFALGPLLLIATGSEGILPFISTSTLILVAAIPLFVARGYSLAPVGSEKTAGVWKIFMLAPTIMLANIVYAASQESMVTFFPLFGVHMGLSTDFSLWLMTMIAVGSMVLILPLGWLADHVNRMGLLVGCIVLTMLGLLAMPYLIPHTLPAQIFAFVFGGVEGMIYALGVILIGEQFKGAMLAAASTTFTACWAAGTVIGPFLVGVGMDHFGDQHMLTILFFFFAIYLPFPVVAWIRSLRPKKII
jgi:MFS family permease